MKLKNIANLFYAPNISIYNKYEILERVFDFSDFKSYVNDPNHEYVKDAKVLKITNGLLPNEVAVVLDIESLTKF